MAYSELIKNFESVRDYMRQFYVYGFKSRNEYNAKSSRSYDNERRRIESWMGDYMSFRQTESGKNIFLSVDSRAVTSNPLYKAFKAKSFTAGDVILHFYLLDILDGEHEYSVKEIMDIITDRYLSQFEEGTEMDVSSVRKKLKEYETLGLFKSRKSGKELLYSRTASELEPDKWSDAWSFYSEADPLGVIGSTLMDKLDVETEHFRFKHHYLLDALNAQIICVIVDAISQKCCIDLTVKTPRSKAEKEHRVYPLKIFVSTQTGRQYLLSYHYRLKKPMFFRLDTVHDVKHGPEEKRHLKYSAFYDKFAENLWGVSTGIEYSVDHVEMLIHFEANERFILERINREKRHGTVEIIDDNTCKFAADVYDAAEMLPWIRTFIGRIVSFSCSNTFVQQRFYEDLAAMAALYGGESDAV